MLVRKFINLFVLVLMSFLFLFNCGNNDSKLIIPAESIDINESNYDFVLVGDTVHYTSSVIPSTISASKIQWSSLNEKVATVSETGVLTALRRGETILKASIDDVESTITIRVRNIPQGYIRLHFNTGFNNENLGLGFWSNDAIEANRLYYIIDDESYSYANPYPIDNSQSDTFGVYVDIPVIDEYGSIWVDLLIHYDTSNEYNGLCEVDIKDIDKYNEFWIDVNNSKVYYDEPNINYPISSLIIRNEYFDLSPGDTIQLNHQKNSQETNINFVSKEWLSSNNEVAEINDSGLLTVMGYGNVKIILRANGFETEKEFIFVKPQEINIIRVHYLRYDNNYKT